MLYDIITLLYIFKKIFWYSLIAEFSNIVVKKKDGAVSTASK